MKPNEQVGYHSRAHSAPFLHSVFLTPKKGGKVVLDFLFFIFYVLGLVLLRLRLLL
jgi:hypothetical protein